MADFWRFLKEAEPVTQAIPRRTLGFSGALGLRRAGSGGMGAAKSAFLSESPLDLAIMAGVVLSARFLAKPQASDTEVGVCQERYG